MPECYLLAVAQTSSLDSATNNWSLFNLVEQIHLLADQVAITKQVTLPLEVHVYWQLSPDEVSRDFEFRLVAKTGSEESPLKPITLRTDKTRYRIRIQGFVVPYVGDVRLQTEWRFGERDQWHRCSIFWPLQIEVEATKARSAS
jgi:hypothetical protein